MLFVDQVREGVRACNSKLIFFVLFLAVLLPACTRNDEARKFRIGFSQCTGDEKWKKASLESMKKELAFHPGSELIYKNAQDNSKLQVRQIRELLMQNIDILLVSPNEAEPLTAVVEETFNRGIPVIVIDRKVNSNLYTSFVGADNYEIGKMAGNYIANLFKDSTEVVEIIGLKGSTPSSERQNGFAAGIRSNPLVRIKAEVYGDWLKEKSAEALTAIRDRLSPTDVVFAHNDPMALGAYEVYQQLGMGRKANIIGVDGLAGPGGGIELVSNRILKATLLNPPGGEEALQVAFNILNKQPYLKENTLSTVVIDSTNVRILKMQTDKINSQQKDIEHQQDILREQRRIYDNQNMILNTSISALVLLLVLGGITFYALRNNRRINKKLQRQNEEILQQRNQLIEMTAKVKKATDTKLNFFTNISHEFRTPLTLILAPLEDILTTPRLSFPLKNRLELVQKNVLRLLRLVNQLMDFRQLEIAKMKLKASENNLVSFVTEVSNAFQDLATKKSIDFSVIPKVQEMKIWFDVNLLDKVLFNLLSNAFKFTPEHGTITVIISRSPDQKHALVNVEDSGVGMSPEVQSHAFDLFYQGYETDLKGSGLGLALSKQIIQLHHGTITCKSDKWKGSSFEITLPLGNAHLRPDEQIELKEPASLNYEHMKVYDMESEPLAAASPKAAAPVQDRSILVIEDNSDLRQFLKTSLGSGYEIHEAAAGNAGLSLAYEIIPDLIICDIMLPGNQSGLNITETLKNDFRTSHIPIIILTAKAGMDEHIEGMRLKADSFIVKPFNLQYLQETIKSLLKNRDVLRDHYTSELPTEIRTGASKKIDRKFLNEFAAVVEKNIGNEAFGVDDISREMGVSRIQLYRKVKALLGYNVNDYILTVRMQKAKFMLVNESLSMYDIALRSGFSSQAYFSTVFKSKFSMTPTEYREKHVKSV